MSETKFRARARVQVTLDVDAGSVWGLDCEMSQLVDQASRETTEQLKRHLKGLGGVRIIGEPKITAIFAEQ